MSDVNIGIGVDTTEAEKGLESFKNKMTKFGAAIAAGFAAIKIGEFLADGIKEAIEAEKSLAKLATQLKVTGEFSDAAVAEFDAFASALERATNVSAEAILEQTALAKSFGLSNEESKKLVSAATQLSAITGDDLSSSVDTLIKSYQGQTRQLSKVIGETATLTKEQLKNGAAIDLINSKYAGTAEASLNTYSGALAALERGFGDISEEIGKAIIGNQSLIGVIRAVTKSFEGIVDFLAKNKGPINSFVSVLVDGFFGAAKGATFLASIIERALGGAMLVVTIPLEGLIGALEDLAKIGGKATQGLAEGFQDANVFLKNFNNAAIDGVGKNTGAFAKLNEEIGDVQKSIKGMSKQVETSGNQIDKATKDKKPFFTSQEIEKARTDFTRLSNDIFQIVASETDKINKKRREQILEIQSLRDKQVITEKEKLDTILKINEAAQKQITNIEKDETKKRQDEALANPIKIFYEKIQSPTAELGTELKAIGANMAAGFFTALNAGADGANQAAANIAGAVGTALGAIWGIPFIGDLFKTVFEFTNQSAEAIQEDIKAFVNEIPAILERTAEAGPAIAEAFMTALFEDDFGGRMARALGNGLAAPFNTLARKWGIDSADEFGAKISAAWKELMNGFENTFLGKFFTSLGTLFTNIYKGAANLLDGVFGGLVQKIGELFQGLFSAGQLLFENIGAGLSNIFNFFSEALANLGPNVAASIGGVFDGIKEFFQGLSLDNIADTFTKAFDDILDGIKAVFKPITDAIGAVTGGGGGSDVGAKISSGFKTVFGLAEGGVVPPGYPNDTYPAFLTSGETVTPPGKLPDSSGNNDVMIALLGKILSKLSEPMSVSTTAEVNGRALADIILNLNRNNARLA